jgi:hypothetical protein
MIFQILGDAHLALAYPASGGAQNFYREHL